MVLELKVLHGAGWAALIQYIRISLLTFLASSIWQPTGTTTTTFFTQSHGSWSNSLGQFFHIVLAIPHSGWNGLDQ
jgi:hypothetical protein